MKRCPQCEFIYEDDQVLCDMDGAQLLHESGPAAVGADASRRSEVTPAKPRWRALAFGAIIVFALVAVLFGVYYVSARLVSSKREIPSSAPAIQNRRLETSTPRPTPTLALAETPAPARPTAVAPPIVNRAATKQPSPDQSSAGDARVSRPPQSVTPSTIERRSPVLKPEPRPQKPPSSKPSPVNADQSDSKLGSFLKKTRRILKKPFSGKD